MQLLKLTSYASLFITLLVLVTSCEKDFEKDKGGVLYKKSEIPLTGAQSVPANNSTGLGQLSVTYSKGSKTLSYSFTWSGLRDTISGVALHGPSPSGYASAIKQNFTAFGSDLKANQRTYPYQGGSYSGFVAVDDQIIKEQEILNSLYYISIRTKAFPGGEIRAQVRFQ